MSDTRETIDLTNSAIPPRTVEEFTEVLTGKETPAEVDAFNARKRAFFKRRAVRILERGHLADRLNVPLPPNVYGEWVANDPVEITRMQLAGFEEDHKYATSHALHNDGTGRAKLGDVIFMTTDKMNYEVIEEYRRELFDKTHGKKKNKPKEEAEFAPMLEGQGIGKVINDSNLQIIDREQIQRIVTTG